ERLSSQQQIASLAAQVAELAQLNKTLQRYLEEVVSKVSPKKSANIIEAENKRLAEVEADAKLISNKYVSYLIKKGIEFPIIKKALETSENLEEFDRIVSTDSGISKSERRRITHLPPVRSAPLSDLNKARELIGQTPFSEQNSPDEEAGP